MDAKPVFLFAFANDASQSLKLDEEWRQAEKALQAHEDAGKLVFNLTPAATLNDIWDKFHRFHGRVAIFHYGGHSGSQALNLADATLKGKSLATLIGQEENLKLAFLNGCSNAQQVETLFAQGVPAVIATSAPIQDRRAIDLSKQFYSALTSGKAIKEAFDAAAAYVNNAENEVLVSFRGVAFDQDLEEFPWGLYVQDEQVLKWKIPEKEVPIQSILGKANIYGDERKAIPKFHTPFPSSAEKIIGREADIQYLRQEMLHAQVPILLNGMGGIGKTRMAIEYANRFKEEYDYIVWIEQFGDLSTNLVTNFALNQALSFQPTKDLHADVRSILFQLSRLEGSLLLVIDNTDEQVEELATLIPKPPKAHVLLTSRQELSSFFSSFQLGFLNESFARALFYEHYKRERNDEAVNLILQSIDYHTLTIELFSKTAEGRKIGLEKLKQLVEERGLALGKRADDIKLIRDPKHQLKKIFPFLQIVFDISGLTKGETELLQKLAALPPTFIQLSGLAYLLNVDQEEEESWDGLTFYLGLLQEKGWLIYEGSPEEKGQGIEEGQTKNEEIATDSGEGAPEEAYKMHRVIRDAVWEQLKPSFDSVQAIFEQVSQLLHIDQSKDNPIEKFPFVPFGEQLLSLEWYEEAEEEQKSSIALLQSNLATVYKDLGRYEEAAGLLEKALASDQANFGEAHPNVAISQSNLATVYKDLGRYEEAAGLLEKALASDQANFGEAHPNVARSQSNLALVYQDLGRYEEAAGLLEKALASDQANFGEAHPNVARSQSNLATVYKDLGRYEEAAGLLEKALASDQANFGEAHPNVARSQSNLATVYQDLGRYEEAAGLLEKALASAQANFGEAHPNVARSQSNLATVYKDLGRYEEAAGLLEKALASDQANFGEAHPNVAISQSNLATVYKDLGRYEEAAGLLEKALASDQANFGEAHPNVAISQSNLATVYKALGRYEEAAGLLEKALASAQANFGEAHPNVARSQSNLALVYQDLGRYEEAAGLLEKALASDQANFGEAHPNVARSQSNLATVYQDLGRYEEAAGLLEKALASDQANFGEAHPNVAIRQSNFGKVLRNLGRNEEALALLWSALKNTLQNFGEEHVKIAVRKKNIALVYKDMGKFSEAKELLEEALAIDLKYFGEKHFNVADRRFHLAEVYQGQGNTKNAKEMGNKALATLRDIFGDAHPKTKTVRQFLAKFGE